MNKIASWLNKNTFTAKMLHSYGFRTIVFSIISLVISLFYSLYNAVIGIMFSSIWFGALAAYYIMLTLMRSKILFYHKNARKKKHDAASLTPSKRGEIKAYRACGIFLIILPLALSIAIVQMVVSQKSFEHAGITIYVAAVYTFYKIVSSTIHFVKARKNKDMTVQAVRNINLADALVSILALQTAMFRAFSSGSNSDIANILTGAGVCALTIILGIYMWINANLSLRKLKTVRIDTIVDEPTSCDESTMCDEPTSCDKPISCDEPTNLET